MKPSDFEVSKDDSGKHYVNKTVSEVTKHQTSPLAFVIEHFGLSLDKYF
jgi:hypothetical protein